MNTYKAQDKQKKAYIYQALDFVRVARSSSEAVCCGKTMLKSCAPAQVNTKALGESSVMSLKICNQVRSVLYCSLCLFDMTFHRSLNTFFFTFIFFLTTISCTLKYVYFPIRCKSYPTEKICQKFPIQCHACFNDIEVNYIKSRSRSIEIYGI